MPDWVRAGAEVNGASLNATSEDVPVQFCAPLTHRRWTRKRRNRWRQKRGWNAGLSRWTSL